MSRTVHFISGLPRSGSTLLSALLRQNPRFHAAMTSPVGALFLSMVRDMSAFSELGLFFNDARRRAVLAGLFESYYFDLPPEKLVFDTNRLWSAKLPALIDLFPAARVICCVRHLGWIMDSIERLIRRNYFQPSKMFNFEAGGTVYTRVDALAQTTGMVGMAWSALKEAYYGEQADRILVVEYDTLARTPRKALAAIYDFVGEPSFAHDFNNVEYDEPEFDAWLGAPGLHRVHSHVRHEERQTILPPDLFRRFDNDSFWADPALNLRNVRVI